MEAHLLSAAQGVHRALDGADRLLSSPAAAQRLRHFCERAYLNAASGTQAPDIQGFGQDTDLDIATVRNLLNSLLFIYRGAVEHGVEAEALAAVLGRTTDTSDEFRRVISGALGASTTGSGAMEAMSVGRLAKTDWKVEFVTSSSRCKALRAPLVQMVFHVADGYGGVRVQPVEMTVAEFERFRTVFHEAAASMERT